MRMGVDQTRNDDVAVAIDDFCLARQLAQRWGFSDRCNPIAINSDVATRTTLASCIDGGDYGGTVE